MKIVVVGLGSIGTRHLTNLIEMGFKVCAVDVDPSKLLSLPNSVNGYTSLEEALNKEDPSVAFICTLSHQHISTAIICAKHSCHLFIEKPLALDLTGVDELISISREKGLITMVGCNMRFHPAIMRLHEVIQTEPEFKKPLWASMEVGYYLPLAKPDYKQSYQANRALGGDLIFDCIHELDYAGFFFGNALKVFCRKGKLSSLEIDTEDYADIMIEFESGLACNIHMDYLQYGYSRSCKIVAECGTIVWDFTRQNIGIINSTLKNWQWRPIEAELYFNQMYIDEVRYFLDCITSSRATFNSISDSVATIKLAIAANRSAETGSWEFLESIN